MNYWEVCSRAEYDKLVDVDLPPMIWSIFNASFLKMYKGGIA